MAYEIIYSFAIKKDIEEVLFYLLTNCIEKEINKFYTETERKTDLISHGIINGRRTADDSLAKSIQILPNTRLYYEINGNQLHLLRLWDMMQSPDKNPYE